MANQQLIYKDTIGILSGDEFFPAEIHGYICGIICGTNKQEENQQLFQLALNKLQEENISSKVSKDLLAKLMLDTFDELQNPNFEFHLLLPDDDQSMQTQIKALSKWCENFLSGLGHSGMKKIKKTEINESLTDILEVTKAREDKKLLEEESKFAFMELVEYVKVAVLLIYLESTKP